MPFVAPRPNYWTHPTLGVNVGRYGDSSMMGGHRGYDFGLDPNEKGGKRKKSVLSAAGAARQLARNEVRLRLLRQLKKSKGAHQRGGTSVLPLLSLRLPPGKKKRKQRSGM